MNSDSGNVEAPASAALDLEPDGLKKSPENAANESVVIDLGDGVTIGGKTLALMAGPCAIESMDQALEVATSVRAAGVRILRGGTFKMRTSPYSFQGLEEEAFTIAAEVCRETGLKFVTEVIDEHSLELAVKHADMIQIGTRNMYNYPLLKMVGACRTPVLLKRGFSATLDEYVKATEYILSGGNQQLILCERGIRTFCTHTRYTLDLNIVPALKQRTGYPVIVDPSHGTGERAFVGPMARAAIACGADGLLMEVHGNPEKALSDGRQSLSIPEFQELVPSLGAVAVAVGRDI